VATATLRLLSRRNFPGLGKLAATCNSEYLGATVVIRRQRGPGSNATTKHRSDLLGPAAGESRWVTEASPTNRGRVLRA